MDVLHTWAHVLLPGITDKEWFGIIIGYTIVFIINRICRFVVALKGWDHDMG